MKDSDWSACPERSCTRYRALGYWQGQSLGTLLRERARCTPAGIAVIDTACRHRYDDLDALVDRRAAGLHRLGIRPQDKVLMQLPNCTEFLVVFFALQRIGAVPVLALPAHRHAEIAHLLELSQASAYVIPDIHAGFDYRAMARSLQPRMHYMQQILVAGAAEEFTPLASVDAPPAPFPEPPAHALAVLLISGGTTGLPKLIPRTHDDYSYNARASAAAAGLTADTRYLACLPIAHNFALACPGVLGTLHAGGTVVLSPDPSPDCAFELIEKERVTITALVPSLLMLWLEAAEWHEADLSSLQLIQIGGARLKSTVAARVGPELGCNLQQVYGMAEGLVCCTRLGDTERLVFDTQGKPLSEHDEIRIVDDQDIDMEDGETGHLLVRGPYTIHSYYRAAAHDRSAFTSDGFYRSGDLARRLPSGHLVIEGRDKDVINRCGEKVLIEEIENHILTHPSVRDVALVALPDPLLGECSCACVVTSGAALTLPQLRAFLERLGVSTFKFPDRLHSVDALPKTPLGKIDRRALAQHIASGAPA